MIAHFNSSWCVRVRRDDLLTMQVDGTKGTAVAGLRECWIQPYGATPRPVWNPDVESPLEVFRRLAEGAGADNFDNAFKRQWELYPAARREGRAVPLGSARGRERRAACGEGHRESWQKRCWVADSRAALSDWGNTRRDSVNYGTAELHGLGGSVFLFAILTRLPFESSRIPSAPVSKK